MACKISPLLRAVTKNAIYRHCVYRRAFCFSSSTPTIFRSPYPDLNFTKAPLPEYLFRHLDHHGDKTALVDIETGRSYTCRQTKTYAVKIASAIRKLGYKKGDVIAIHATNSAEYAILLLALPAAGVTITTSNSSFTSGELARNLELSSASGIFTTSSLLPVVKDVLHSNEVFCKNMKEIITIDHVDGYKSLSSLMEDDGKAFSDDLVIDLENDLVVLPFSSGTTGLPKPVMLNHRSIVTNLQQMRYVLNTTPEDSFIGVLPFFHAYGMIIITYYAFQGGNKLVTVPRFEPGTFLQSIQDQKVSFLHLVPPMALFLAKHPIVNDFNLSSVKTTLCGAAPMGVALSEEFTSRLNIPLRQGFGMTEMGPADIIDREPLTIGTVGHLFPNTQCKIINSETGNVVPNVGDQGEICLKGPQLMKGYLNNPEATSDAVKDGWMHTGDIGYMQEDGKCVITDRVKDLIKYKGFQIPPAELENILLRHPEIQDAAVLGVPDEKAGEVPRAYIVPKLNSKINESDVSEFVKEQVSDFKLLRGGIEFINEIPKSPSGKILKRTMKEQFLKHM